MKKTLRHLDKNNLYQSDDDESEILHDDSPSYSSDEDEIPKESESLVKHEKEDPLEVAKVQIILLFIFIEIQFCKKV